MFAVFAILAHRSCVKEIGDRQTSQSDRQTDRQRDRQTASFTDTISSTGLLSFNAVYN